MNTDRDILKESLKSQFDFHFDGMRRLLELTGRFLKEGSSDGNQQNSGAIQAIFAHILRADRFWRGVLTDSTETTENSFDATSVDNLIAWNESERANWNKYFADLDDSKLIVRSERNLPFGKFSFTLGQALQHVILHGLQHHTEIAQLLTEAGYSPGDVDYFDYFAIPSDE